jgi:hypothetical protein
MRGRETCVESYACCRLGRLLPVVMLSLHQLGLETDWDLTQLGLYVHVSVFPYVNALSLFSNSQEARRLPDAIEMQY